jgi:cystathionine beta-synthase
MDELQRCLAFDRRVALCGGGEQIELPVGWVVRRRDLPRVFSLNMVILGAPTPSTFGVHELERLLDEWLADVDHRYVRLEDPAAADRLGPELLSAGWERQRTLIMVLADDAPAGAGDPRARQISAEELDAVMLADFRATDYPPATHPGLAEELVRAQRCLREGTTALRFGAGQDDGLQSMCTLFMDEGPDGHRMAMVEQVATLPDYRERGLARSVVSAAISAAREWGADTVMVPADADDWPQIMYAGLGFAPVGQHTSFLRRPRRTSGRTGPSRGPKLRAMDNVTAVSPVKDSILDTIGNTPLVRLSRIGAGLQPQVIAKLETFNPGGSIKDRIAVSLIEAAERDGKLRPGGTIVEPTSGNTGTGLAIAARLKGYRVIAVMPDKMSREKIDLLRAYGAEVVVAPTDVAPDSPQSYYRVADRLTAEIPGAFQPNQYANPANPQTHYESTGPELWEQLGDRLTHLVVGVGTGGTITGMARALRERIPDLVVVGADPEGSIYSGGEANVRPYLVEGVGEDFWPQTFDPSVVDRWVTVSDRDAFVTTRRLAQTEGILAGGSGGLALHAALEVAAEVQDPEAAIVVIIPDGGRSYLSKIYSDAWMRQYGFLERGADLTVGDVLRYKRETGDIPSLITVEPHFRVRDAVALFHQHRVSQLPVVSADDPTEIIGAIGERGLLRHAAADPGLLDAEIAQVMEPPFAAVASEDPVREAVELLAGEQQALLVTYDGRAEGLVTRTDLLEAMAS